jgi:histone-lysine N-methyltransferase SETD2
VNSQQQAKQKEIAHIIAAANAAAEAEATRLAAAAAAGAVTAPAPETVKRKSRPPRKQQTKEDKEANKEKRLMKLVGAVVVKCMSRYSGKMETEMFKKYAKEVRLLRVSCTSLILVPL